MDKDKLIPDHVFDTFKNNFKTESHPNIIRTRNMTKLGVDTLIEKNGLEWSSSIFDEVYYYTEGLIQWGKNSVWFYFKKIDNDSTYKMYILTNKDQNLTMLMNGLNKYFTIDRL